MAAKAEVSSRFRVSGGTAIFTASAPRGSAMRVVARTVPTTARTRSDGTSST